MIYNNIVNEKLRIAAIHIADLEYRYAISFLEQWGEGATLEDLTLYYDPENDYLVLNMDRKDYELYLDITETFLSSDYTKAMEAKNKVTSSMRETMEVLATCMWYRRVKKEMKVIGQQAVVGFANTFIGKIFDEIIRNTSSTTFMLSQAFNYGLICGKREERARRKK